MKLLKTTAMWGGHMEIFAAVRMFNKSIVVVRDANITRIVPEGQPQQGEPVYFYYTGSHYDFLEPV